jgi:hypothetical protein
LHVTAKRVGTDTATAGRWLLSYAMWIGVSMELFMLAAAKASGKKTGGDLIDIAIFVIMYFVTLRVLARFESDVRQVIETISSLRKKEKKILKKLQRSQRAKGST